jgi:hypothetical protein
MALELLYDLRCPQYGMLWGPSERTLGCFFYSPLGLKSGLSTGLISRIYGPEIVTIFWSQILDHNSGFVLFCVVRPPKGGPKTASLLKLVGLEFWAQRLDFWKGFGPGRNGQFGSLLSPTSVREPDRCRPSLAELI